MEQFVLGIFQEHLSKFIIGFRKEQVNANLLNGKGEIKNVELNCNILNEMLMKVTPYVELERIHVSKISFHVESWTNLRKAPIHIDLEHITAEIIEPLHYIDRINRKSIQQITSTQLKELIKAGKIPKLRNNTSYNLLDRILDNLTIEIKSITITYQTIGKFKTRRQGVWTPPAIRIQLYSIRFVPVNEYGMESTPDDIWKHNHDRKRKYGDYIIYKKLETEYKVSIVINNNYNSNNNYNYYNAEVEEKQTGQSSSNENDDNTIIQSNKSFDTIDMSDMYYNYYNDNNDNEIVIPIVSSTKTNYNSNNNNSSNNRHKVQIQIAMQRRIRDGECLAVQIDVTIPVIEINIDSKTIPLLAHLLIGIQYCLAKNKQFIDPLLLYDNHNSNQNNHDEKSSTTTTIKEPIVLLSKSSSSNILESTTPVDSTILEGQQLLNLADDLSSSSSSSDDDDDENDNDNDNETTTTTNDNNNTTSEVPTSPVKNTKESINNNKSKILPPISPIKKKEQKERPLLVLPNGIVFHDKVSFSLSIHHATIRGTYAESVNGCINITINGAVIEAMWPKVTKEKGGYAQASISYVMIEEQHGQRIRPLLVGGGQYDHTGPPEQPGVPLNEVGRDETFPLFEDRSVRPDPLGLRFTFPAQALGYKMTVGYNTKLSSDSDNSNHAEEEEEEMMVLNEVGIDQFDIVLDSGPWARLLKFALHVDGGGFDPRWHTGDWTDLLTTDMLVRPSNPLDLDEHLQTLPKFFLDENEFISSDLFNATVRVRNITLRIPAAIHDDIRSCDIVIKVDETMAVASSALPRNLITNENDEIDYPSDPSDIVFMLDKAEDPANRQLGIMTSKAVSTFRSQLTVRGLAVKLSPVIPFQTCQEPQHLLLPAELTSLLCFEGEPPDDNTGDNADTMTVAVSVVAHRFDVNLDFDLLASAASTLITHVENVRDTIRQCAEVATKPNGDAGEMLVENDERISSSLKGRKILVHRQISRCRETCGIDVACCMQIAETKLTLWRHNVPRSSPLRPTGEDNGEFAQLLRLLTFDAKKIEIGAEGSFRKNDRHLLLKFRLADMSLHICAFQSALNDSSLWLQVFQPALENVKSRDPKYSDTEMVEIVSFIIPENSKYAMAIRLEEIWEGTRTWAFSSELCGGKVRCHVEDLEFLSLLILEELLMPSWRKNHLDVGLSEGFFPHNTIGAFLISLLPARLTRKTLSSTEALTNIAQGSSTNETVDRILTKVSMKFIPDCIDLVLLRVLLEDVQVLVPLRNAESMESGTDEFGAKILSTEFTAGYVTSDSLSKPSILNICAKKETNWSSLVSIEKRGICHGLKSRQCLFFQYPSISKIEEVVETFECGYAFGGSSISIAMSDDLSLGETQRLEDFFVECLKFSLRCKAAAANLACVVNGLDSVSHKKRKRQLASKNNPHPINVACSSALGSLRSVKTLFRKLHENFLSYDDHVKTQLSDKDQELAALRILVFKKEKERLAALSLVSNEASGWLKIGAAGRTGQRGLMTSTLWSHWVVLRRSLLLSYTGPSYSDVVDIICLSEAKLHTLSGGQRKRDLKRAFALVEKSGTIHFLVATSDTEYAKWVSVIHSAIQRFSSEDFLRDNATQNGTLTRESSSRSITSGSASEPISKSSNHGRNLGRNFSRVVNAARNRRKDESSKDDKVQGNNDNQTIDNSLNFVSSSVDERAAASEARDNGTRESDGQDNRRNMLRNRFAGVGQATKRGIGSASQVTKRGIGSASQVTKNRFGSALQAAREKGKQVAERRRNRNAATDVVADQYTTATLPSVGSHPRESWTCGLCGKENFIVDEPCAFCSAHDNSNQEISGHAEGSVQNPTDLSNTDAPDLREGSINADAELDEFPTIDEDGRGVDVVEEEETEATPDDGSFISEELEEIDDPKKPRIGMKQRFGAAVRRARDKRLENRGMDVGRNSFHTRKSFEGSTSMKFRNIQLGEPISTFNAPFDGCAPTKEDVKLRRFDANFFVRVESDDSSRVFRPDDLAEVSSTDSTAAPTEESNDALGVKKEVSGIAEEENSVQLKRDNSFNGEEENDNATLEGQEKLLTAGFRIYVFQRNNEKANNVQTVICKKIPDVMELCTSLSEALSRVPSYQFNTIEGMERKSGVSLTANITSALGLTSLDSVRVAGKILSGLVDLWPDGKPIMEYYADVVSEFLNAMLDSPLPVDGIDRLSDFLDLKNVNTRTAPIAEDDKVFPLKKQHESQTGDTENRTQASDIFCLSDLCETELIRAEHQSILAQQLSQTDNQDLGDHKQPVRTEAQRSMSHVAPHSTAIQFRDAMHCALVKVMEERDEAHARMVSASVLHVHEMEQQRKKTNKLTSQLELLKKAASSDPLFSSQRELNKEAMQQDSDAELISLCQQLAAEISARTSASLEIVRLKETRKIEQQHEAAEKQSLKDELIRLQEELEQERQKSAEAQKESENWQKSFKEVVNIQEKHLVNPSVVDSQQHVDNNIHWKNSSQSLGSSNKYNQDNNS